MTACSLLVVAAMAMCLHVAMSQPATGWQFAVDKSDRILATPASGAHTESLTVIAVQGDGVQLALLPGDLASEPDAAFDRISAFREFLSRQGQIARLLTAPDAGLVTADGKLEPLALQPRRHLGQLHWSFWLQLFCGGFGLLLGGVVWAYRPMDSAAPYFAMTSVGLALSAMAAAIYSTRELAIPYETFRVIHATNSTGTLLYAGGFAGVLWHYPSTLGRAPVAAGLLAAYSLLALLTALHWIPTFSLAIRIPCLLVFVLALGFGVVQWRSAERDPLGRAGLRWFLLSWLVGSGLFLALVFVPALMGVNVSEAQGPAFALLLIVHLGMAAGILRHGIFQLEPYWPRIIMLVSSGIVVCLFDLLLLGLLDLSHPQALGLSLIVVGWFYFPLRQWLWSRLFRMDRGGRPALIRMVTDVLSQPDRDAGESWQALLEQAFRPGEFHWSREIHTDAVVDRGLALEVAGASGCADARMVYCHGGARLFSRDDLELLADLREAFRTALGYRERLQAAVAQERDRVARDLHDDVGARLLTLTQRLEPEPANNVRVALAELRAVVYSMQSGPISFDDMLGDWRAETAERCEASNARLTWHVAGQPPLNRVDGGHALALTRVLREAVTNALRHAKPDCLSVSLRFGDGSLLTCIEHRYAGPPPRAWSASLGLHNLRSRVSVLGGEIVWEQHGDQLVTRWQVPLEQGA